MEDPSYIAEGARSGISLQERGGDITEPPNDTRFSEAALTNRYFSSIPDPDVTFTVIGDSLEERGYAALSMPRRCLSRVIDVLEYLWACLTSALFCVKTHLSNAMKGVEGTSSAENPVPPNWLAPGEVSLYYQRTTYGKGLLLGASEILITPHRVILTQTECMRGPLSLPVRQRQQLLDRRLVRGYESGLVLPSCGRLLWGFVLVFFFWTLLDGWLFNVPFYLMAIPIPSVRPVLNLAGGPCSHLASDCVSVKGEDGMTIGEALGFGRIMPPLDSEERESNTEAKTHTSRAAALIEVRDSLQTDVSDRTSSKFRRASSSRLAPDIITNPPIAKPSGCKDFPHWRDQEGQSCDRYAEENWALSCVSGKGTGSDRIDQTALALSADDACCVCGGGSQHSRKKAIATLEGLLRPLAIENSDVLPETSSSQIFTALHCLSNNRLQEWGEVFGSVPIVDIVTTRQRPPLHVIAILKEVHELAVGLSGKWMLLDYGKWDALGLWSIWEGGEHGDYGTFEIRKLADHFEVTLGASTAALREEEGRMSANIPEFGQVSVIVKKDRPNELVVRLKKNADSHEEELEASRIMDKSSSRQTDSANSDSLRMKAWAMGITGILAIRCLFRIIAIIGIIHGVLIIVGWICQRFFTSRIYVTLKVHADYFGSGTQPDLWQKRLGEHDISNVYGFYLPDATWAPGKLPALAMALLDQNFGPNVRSREPSIIDTPRLAV